MSQTVVIVEDEIKIAEILLEYLQSHGYQTKYFSSGKGLIEWLQTHPCDCVLLDVMLPQSETFGDGLELCKKIRRFSQVPIVMVTARIEELDRILGLELGADDYICKPFSPREVVARVKALLRRADLTTQDKLKNSSNWQLDAARYQVHYRGRHVDLSAVEFEIIQTLTQSLGQIFSRSQLIANIYHDNRIVCDRTIDSHIKKLRQKLTANLGDNDLIQSVYGVGYRFIIDE